MDPAEISFDQFDHRSSFKSEVWILFEKTACPQCCGDPLKLQRHLVWLLAIWIWIPNCALRSVCGFLLYLLHTVVGDGAMNKLGICFQWHNENFKFRMLLFSVGNGAMNALRYWRRRNERFGILENATNERSAILETAQWINTPRCWQRCDARSTMLSTTRWCLYRCWVETSANTLSDLYKGGMENLNSAF